MKKKLFLLDAYALIFRSYYGFINNPIKNSKGENTSAILGFINTLHEVLTKQKPTHIGVAFDLRHPTFRHEMYAEYKANRSPTPEAIIFATPYIKKILDGLRIPILEIPGYEADDVVGTMVRIAEEKGFETYMMTSDKDYFQLVTENSFVFKPKRTGFESEVWGIEEVNKKYKINHPRQVIDILTLWGDSVDNIPGIDGVGEKTASKLIGLYGSVAGLYENVDKLKGKQKEKVIAGKEKVELSQKLVTICKNVPIEFDEEALKVKDADNEKLQAIFDELELRALAKRILQPPPAPAPQQGLLFGTEAMSAQVVAKSEVNQLATIHDTDHTYHFAATAEDRQKLIELLNSQKEFCFDTETTGLDTLTAELVGMSFSIKSHEAYYVPIPAKRNEANAVTAEFKEIFENTSIGKVGQNLKFDIAMLKAYDIDVDGELFDTMVAHYLIQPELRHNLNALSEGYLKYKPVPIEELIGPKGKNQRNMRQVAPEKIKEYAGEDADLTWQLKLILEKELEKHEMTTLFKEIEMPLVKVLVEMEKNGFNIDTTSLNAYAIELNIEIAQLEKDITELSGTTFNIGSPKQLGEVLFEKMKIIPNPKKTKTNQYATGESELLKIQGKHPIIDKILEFRSLKKLVSTYVEALPKLINVKTKKIHSSFNQAIVATGRLSSTNPNLQNIPIKDANGREIRKAFVPSDDEHILISADYSQVELRIMAHLSKDPTMIEAFNNEADIHSATAAKIFNVDIKEVTKEMRSKAKSANFGIIYGVSAHGLSENLHISRKEAKELIDGYFNTYPKIKEYMEEIVRIARIDECVVTIKGRKRYLQEINSKNPIVQGIGKRNAINAPIQGSAADIIKIAMINIQKLLKSNNYKTKMILQVHDELIFDVYKPELDEIQKLVKTEMESAVQLDVPLTVDAGVGNNWLEAH